MVVGFSLFAVLSAAALRSGRHPAFSAGWVGWLVATGIGLGCVSSVKFVGLFTVLVVGCMTCIDLWAVFGDTTNSLGVVGAHFTARVAALILLPGLLYTARYYPSTTNLVLRVLLP